MKTVEAINVLSTWDQKGRYVFLKRDLAKLFHEDSPKTFTEGLQRLVKGGILERVCKGVYLNPRALSQDSYTIERITNMLRRGEYNYVSLESMLSEYGVISQIPMDRLTVMTTGRKGEYHTSYGTIEFTHTKRSRIAIIESTYTVEGRPLRLATKEQAWRDLKRVGRNVHLVNQEELGSE